MSIIGLDPDRTVTSAGRELRISPKHAREVTRSLKNMKLESALEYLDEVIALKRSVPFRRYNKKIGHRSDIVGWYSGRYPVRAAREIKKVLENLENNAYNKGLDVEKLKLVHIISLKSRKIEGFMPRAQGSSSPSFKTLTHIEAVAEEIE